MLSTETEFQRNYDGEAYAAYFKSPGTMFPIPKHNEALPEKEWVVGVINDGKAVAFPLAQGPLWSGK